MKTKLLVGLAILLLFATTAPAAVLDFSASSGSLSADVTFAVSGSNLIVTLTNTSTADVLNPTQVLTAVFFGSSTPLTLTPISATLAGGSTVFFGPTNGGNVGGEWAYKSGISDPSITGSYGISSTGLGIFGPANNFPGANLEGPVEVNGVEYGITSAGDDPTTGNNPVTGMNALIKNSVMFTLSGLPGGFDPSLSIFGIQFQYGTSLNETRFPVPEPGTFILLGAGLVGFAVWGKRKKVTS